MMMIKIRRQWNDWRIAEAPLDKLSGFHWSTFSGGVRAPSPRPHVHAYVSCADIVGDIAHSCRHGQGPHSIKVCIVRKDQTREEWAKVMALAGAAATKSAGVS
jgi:hypothetical protein